VKLLLVDDSDLMRRGLRRMLEKPNDEVPTANDGVAALHAAETFDPDVVTMDISMPNMDGLTCIEGILRIRPKARILVVSALKDKPTAVEAIKRGAQGYLIKPFTAEALCAEVADLFEP
jgi:two-component system chemotaxis response regulator CheY